MIRKRTAILNLLGLWVFGMIVGANIRELLPGGASWPAEVMIGIGVVGSAVMFGGLYRALR
ncbi:MAG: hypothetical protein GY926_20995 [bacterium]|nr:hypothetical protein [bacterium]